MNSDGSSELCTQCGLCCNGAIFARGELRVGEDPDRMKALGLRIRKGPSGCTRFAQPCSAFERGICTIYAERPGHCRDFECLLLKRFNAGTISLRAARKLIRSALNRTELIERLLRKLGDKNEQLPLDVRFRRLNKPGSVPAGRKQAELFGRLTEALHALNHLLAESFYPGEIRSKALSPPGGKR